MFIICSYFQTISWRKISCLERNAKGALYIVLLLHICNARAVNLSCYYVIAIDRGKFHGTLTLILLRKIIATVPRRFAPPYK